MTPATRETADHAELARIEDVAKWFESGDPGANGSVLLSASVAAEHARDLRFLLSEIAALRGERDRLRNAASKSNEEVCQSLGKALGYPWFKDDQANFPGSTESDGVCVGDHVAESIADEAARRLTQAERQLDELRKALEWYGEQARLARLIHREGDAGRHALADDGGMRARQAIANQGADQ